MSTESRLRRVTKRVRGTTERPRLCATFSNRQVRAQIIDDEKGITLVFSESTGYEGNLTEKAARIGKDIAQKAVKVKIKKVVFDRRGKKYHGRVMALAEAARKQGLEF